LIFLLFLITLFLCYRIQKPITEEQETEVDDIENNLEDQREQIQIWEAAYKHPLLVSPSEVGITRDVRTVSYVLLDE